MMFLNLFIGLALMGVATWKANEMLGRGRVVQFFAPEWGTIIAFLILETYFIYKVNCYVIYTVHGTDRPLSFRKIFCKRFDKMPKNNS